MKKIIILIFTLNILFAFVDKNNNGIMDSWEKKYNITDANADPDSDGLSNYEEFIRQSDPLKYNNLNINLIKSLYVENDMESYNTYLNSAINDRNILFYNESFYKIYDKENYNLTQIAS